MEAAQTAAVDVTVGPGGLVTWNGAPLTGDAAIEAKLADAAQGPEKPALRVTPGNGTDSAALMHLLMLMQPYHYQISIVTKPAP